MSIPVHRPSPLPPPSSGHPTDILMTPPGALFTDIAPSAIAIGIYFCFADLILIAQCLYYNALNARRRRAHERQRHLSTNTQDSAISEEEPLLSRRRSSSGANGGGLPGSHRRHSVRRESTGLDPLARIITGEDDTPQRSAWLTNTLSLVAVYVLGVAAWFVSREVIGADFGLPADDGDDAGSGGDAVASPSVIVGQVLGYISAVCYLCARIPQIWKNYKEKSTEGKLFHSDAHAQNSPASRPRLLTRVLEQQVSPCSSSSSR